MTMQKTRYLLLTVSFLLFPITIYYFSPVLIINAGLEGIINGSFIVFSIMCISSIFVGRLFCAYLCPVGCLQEYLFHVNNKQPKQGWKNRIKYGIFIIWIFMIIFSYIHAGGIKGIDFFYQTDHGISISKIQSYVIYYGIVLIILIPSLVGGKRAFCHYFCWMAPFMVIGMRLRHLFHISGLHLMVKSGQCIFCDKCTNACPMGLNTKAMVKNNKMNNTECIQCGACVDNCPQKVLKYTVSNNAGGK
jgi:polyferredoxin